jgi:tetratricopeptide (TPR) repeat protein
MLTLSRGTFSLGVAVCNSRPLRDHILEQVRATGQKVGVVTVSADETDLVEDVASAIRERHPDAIFVFDMESVLEQDGRGKKLLLRLNASREAWPARAPLPVVIWVPAFAASILSTQARDFWSWKSHQFDFVSEMACLREGITDRVSGRVDLAVNLTLDDKQFRLAELTQRLREAGESPPSELVSHVIAWYYEVSFILRTMGRPREAIEACERALGLSRKVCDENSEAACLGGLGLVYDDLGKTKEAIGYFEAALAIDRRTGSKQGQASAMGNLGIAYTVLGETKKAIEYHEKALAIHRAIGDRRGEAAGLGNLGNVFWKLGKRQKAIEHFEESLVIDRAIGERRGEAADLGNLGNASINVGKTNKAVEYYEMALAIHRNIGDRQGEAIGLWNLAMAFEKLGQVEKAVPLAEQALQIMEAIEDPDAKRVRSWLEEHRSQEEKDSGAK